MGGLVGKPWSTRVFMYSEFSGDFLHSQQLNSLKLTSPLTRAELVLVVITRSHTIIDIKEWKLVLPANLTNSRGQHPSAKS